MNNKLGWESTSRHWLALIANTNEAFSIRHEGTNHEKFAQNNRMSYILICVRVALAASDVQSILGIPATDEIHMEDLNHGLAWTKPNHAKQSTDLRVNSYILKIKQSFEGQRFPFLTNRSRVWFVNHSYPAW